MKREDEVAKIARDRLDRAERVTPDHTVAMLALIAVELARLNDLMAEKT